MRKESFCEFRHWILVFILQRAHGDAVAPVRRRERGARLPGNAQERMLSETGCGSSHTHAHSHAEWASYSERLRFKSSRIFHCLTRSASPGRTIQRSWERGCGGVRREREARVCRREGRCCAQNLRTRVEETSTECDWFSNNSCCCPG